MNALGANELKTKGMSAIESALANQSEIFISVEGVPKFVVISQLFALMRTYRNDCRNWSRY